jgi:4-diphosphocytidyl-2C-methyl-D-erythritol kinase
MAGEKNPPHFNTFENVAYDVFPGLGVFREHFIKLGAEKVNLAGSGPVLFTIVQNLSSAKDLYKQLEKQRMNPIISKTIDRIENIG